MWLSPVLREYYTHHKHKHTSSERSEMIEVKAPRYRETVEDTGCGNEQIEFLSPELEAGHNSWTGHTYTVHTQTQNVNTK